MWNVRYWERLRIKVDENLSSIYIQDQIEGRTLCNCILKTVALIEDHYVNPMIFISGDFNHIQHYPLLIAFSTIRTKHTWQSQYWRDQCCSYWLLQRLRSREPRNHFIGSSFIRRWLYDYSAPLDYQNIERGCFQGTVAGPGTFIMYTDDLRPLWNSKSRIFP